MTVQGPGVSAFLFSFVERLLIPFGLNHVWWPTFWLQFGEYVNKAGRVVHGDQLIFFAQLKDQVPITAGTFMAGLTPIKMFCIPAIALAISPLRQPGKQSAGEGHYALWRDHFHRLRHHRAD